MTYQDLYLAALYTALEKGGTQEVIDRAISEINEPTLAAFQVWLSQAKTLPRAVCGVPFPLVKPALNAEVLCPTCLNKNVSTNPS